MTAVTAAAALTDGLLRCQHGVFLPGSCHARVGGAARAKRLKRSNNRAAWRVNRQNVGSG